MNHQHLLTLAAVQQDVREHKRRKAAAFHTLWELGQAREALRRMGEVLPEPPPRSREAFADAIYRLADPAPVRHLRLVGGLGEDPLAGDRPRQGAMTGQALRMGHQPPPVPQSEVPGEQARPIFDSKERP